MFILDQDKKNLINVENTICICTESKMITAECTNGRDYVLGKYTTDCRADEVYKTLINTAFAPIVIANNCEINIGSIGELLRPGGVIRSKGTDASVSLETIGIYQMPQE